MLSGRVKSFMNFQGGHSGNSSHPDADKRPSSSNGTDQDAQYYSMNEDDIGEEEDNEEDSDSDESDNSLDKDFNDIGAFTTLRFPSLWGPQQTYQQQLSQSQSQAASKDEVSAKAHLQSNIRDNISRREQLTNFIEDLKSGFSLQSALDRFQTIRLLLESSIDETIDNVVDTDPEDDTVNHKDLDESYEPYVITPAVEPKDVPMLDQVIIPQSKEPHQHKHRYKRHHYHHHRNNSVSHDYEKPEVEALTSISKQEMNDEKFLRKRIFKIRQLSISEEEKNRLVLKLMMGAYYDKIKFVNDNGEEVYQIATKNKEGSSSKTAFDLKNGNEQLLGTGSSESDSEEEDQDILIIDEEDKQAIYHDDDETILGCSHYQRNCKVECPICKKWFGCSICHDDEIDDHSFKRDQTKHVMCLKCFNVQEPSEFCDNCDNKFAVYFCSQCKLYDNDTTKDIYHCDDCGICRLGLGLGQDFFHCKGCNACLSIELQDDHKCIERATQSNCPICEEYMFTSVRPVVFMSCGHAIHQSCYEDHSKHSYKCPTCQKTVLNMEAQFRVLDMEISLQPLPQPYSQWTCIVSCNDCNAKSSCAYHVLGLKCDNCKSYNTSQLKVIKPEESDYDSDISTTTNNFRTRNGNVRDLRDLPMNSNLLAANYNIENDTDMVDNVIGDGSGLRNELTHQSDDSTDVSFANSSPQVVTTPTAEREITLTDSPNRTLTLPQQFLSNFDSFFTNMKLDSSDEEDDDELDFLRVNKTLKSIKTNDVDSNMWRLGTNNTKLTQDANNFADTNSTNSYISNRNTNDDNNNNDDDDNDENNRYTRNDSAIIGSPNTTSNFITTALKDFLKTGKLPNMLDGNKSGIIVDDDLKDYNENNDL